MGVYGGTKLKFQVLIKYSLDSFCMRNCIVREKFKNNDETINGLPSELYDASK